MRQLLLSESINLIKMDVRELFIQKILGIAWYIFPPVSINRLSFRIEFQETLLNLNEPALFFA